MANPFYPPRRTESGRVSRGVIGGDKEGGQGVIGGSYSQRVSFDPDRRGADMAYQRQDMRTSQKQHQQQQFDRDQEEEGFEHYQRRQPTDGPGGAATFYPSEYVSDPAFGTGTDGFGAGQSNMRGGVEQAFSPQQYNSHPFATSKTDYRATFKSNNGKSFNSISTTTTNNVNNVNDYSVTVEQDSPVRERFTEPAYPPSNAFGYSRSTFDLRAPLTAHVDRPDTPGVYLDRAPRMDKLSPEQKEIANTFPKDLDDEGGSLLKTAIHMCKDWRSFVKWKYLHYYVLLVFLCVLVALMTIYHRQIVDWLTPASQKVRELSWGWIIPVVILFILSFPPLFGHEIVGVLCGVVYGLWVGFGILSLGTILGELGNFYAFKYFLQRHGERFEQKSIDYACMAYIVREGGFIIVLLARLSAIPGHFTTAVFSTVGMNVFVFTIAAILSLPKQLVVVYLGVAIEQAGSGTESTRSKVIKWVVLIISFLVTIGVAVYLYGKMQQARPIVQERLRAKRYKMLMEAGPSGAIHLENVAGQGNQMYPSPSDEGFVKGESGSGLPESESMGSPALGDASRPGIKKPSLWARMTGRGGKAGLEAERRQASDTSEVAMHSMHHVSYDPRPQSDIRLQQQPYSNGHDQAVYAYDDDHVNVYADPSLRRPTYVEATSCGAKARPYTERTTTSSAPLDAETTIRVVDDRRRSYEKQQAMAM